MAALPSWRGREALHGIGDEQAVPWRGFGQNGEGEEQKRLTQKGCGHIDHACPLGLPAAIEHHKAIGREAYDGEQQIEADQIRSDEDTKASGKRQQPPGAEARRIRAFRADNPWRKTRPASRAVTMPPEAERPAGPSAASARRAGAEPRRAPSGHHQCGNQARKRCYGQQHRHRRPQGPQQAGGQHRQRHQQRKDEPCSPGHDGATIRPICRRGDGASGTNASASVTSARPSAITCRPCATGLISAPALEVATMRPSTLNT